MVSSVWRDTLQRRCFPVMAAPAKKLDKNDTGQIEREYVIAKWLASEPSSDRFERTRLPVARVLSATVVIRTGS